MYLKIEMSKDNFKILEQDSRSFDKHASNGVRIVAAAVPEMAESSRTLFLRGTSRREDLNKLPYPNSGYFIDFLRALEEVVDSFVVCLR